MERSIPRDTAHKPMCEPMFIPPIGVAAYQRRALPMPPVAHSPAPCNVATLAKKIAMPVKPGMVGSALHPPS
jgi:hypothetical protein